MSLLFCFVLDLVTASTLTISTNINSIPVLNGTNFKNWKENVMIVLDCMDLDLTFPEERHAPLNDKSSTDDKVNMEM